MASKNALSKVHWCLSKSKSSAIYSRNVVESKIYSKSIFFRKCPYFFVLRFYLNSIWLQKGSFGIYLPVYHFRHSATSKRDIFHRKFLELELETKGDKILSIPSCKEQIFLFANETMIRKKRKGLNPWNESFLHASPSFFLYFPDLYFVSTIFKNPLSPSRHSIRVCLFYLLLLFKSWEKVKKIEDGKKSCALLPWQQNDGVNECQIFWIIASLAMFWGIKMQALKGRRHSSR